MTTEAEIPLGSQVYSQTLVDTIRAPGEVDVTTLDLDAGQTLTVVVDPDSSLAVGLEVLGPDSSLLGTAASAAAGGTAALQTLPAALGGTYTIGVSGGGATIGAYHLRIVLNAAVEFESLGVGENDGSASAESIDASATSLGFGAGARAALLGTLDSGISENFESGLLDEQWTTSSSLPEGRIRVTGEAGTAAGDFALIMDRQPSGDANLNEAIWTVDLSDADQPTLRFSHADFGDEQTPLPDNFTGSSSGDGVAVSDDGVTWHTVFTPTVDVGGWQEVVVDLAAVAAANGMTLGSDFQVKFQQYDNFPLPTDGRGYDEIRISDQRGTEDWLRFSLADGAAATIVLTDQQEADRVTLELYDASETLLAVGRQTEGASVLIENFVDRTSDGADEEYFVRVSTTDELVVPYSLLAIREGTLQIETDSNDPLVLSVVDRALGYVAGGAAAITTETEPNDDGVIGGSVEDLPLANDWSGSFLGVGNDRYEASVTGTIRLGEDGDWDFFKVFASPGDRLEIDLRGAPSGAGTLDDPWLRLYDNAGFELASNDDFNGLESFIDFSNFSYAGDYYVVADSFGSSTGSYTLSAALTSVNPLFSNLDDDLYIIATAAGDALRIEVSQPASGPGEFDNELDPALELIDPSGATVASSAGPVLVHSAAQTGDYQVRVLTENGTSGEYVVDVAGASGAAPPFAVIASQPADNSASTTSPAEYVVDFSYDILATSIDAGDLLIDGLAAASVRAIDGNTLAFELPLLGEGVHNAAIIPGALISVAGMASQGYLATFDVDTIPPRVVQTTIQPGDVVAPGAVSLSIQFDEGLKAASLDASDVELTGATFGAFLPSLFDYDASSSTLQLQFDDLPEDVYELRLISGDDAFEDRAGLDLDGEVVTTPIGPNVSGDGVAGGDFVVRFVADHPGPIVLPESFDASPPLGSLIHVAEHQATIDVPGDVDAFFFDLDEGQSISIVAESSDGVTPTVVFSSPVFPLTATAAAAGLGEAAVLQALPVVASGRHVLQISDEVGGAGTYSIRIVLNASVEEEDLLGTSNNVAGAAQALGDGFVDLGSSHGEIASVVGVGDGGPNVVASETQVGDVFAPNELFFRLDGDGPPTGDGVLQVSAVADLDFSSEFLTVSIDGILQEDLFVADGLQYETVRTEIPIPLGTLRRMLRDGAVEVNVTPSAAVDDLGPSELTVTLEYPTDALRGDWYEFALDDGQSTTIAMRSASGAKLELYDGSGELLAMATSAANASHFIGNYVDATSDGVEDIYRVRVSESSAAYALAVVRGGALEAEFNSESLLATDIGEAAGVLGHIVGVADETDPGNPTDANSTEEDRAGATRYYPTVYKNLGDVDPLDAQFIRDVPLSTPAATTVIAASPPLEGSALGLSAGGAIPMLQTFPGPGQTGGVPPDPTAAVGPEQVVGVVNTSIGIYDKTTGEELFLQSLNGSGGFFGGVGATTTVFDPWILFDDETERFFAIAIDIASASESNIFLAVSTDATPTGGNDWHKYKIDFTHVADGTGLGAGAHFPDYPKLGVSDDAIFISGNYFPITLGSGVYAGITGIAKDALLDGGLAEIVYEEFFNGFSVMPMTQYASPATQYFAETSTFGGSSVTIHAVSNVLTAPTRTTASVAVPPFEAPINVPQLGGGTPADAIDARIMTGVYRDDSMWLAHAITDPAIGDGESVVRWYEVATNNFPVSGPTLVQSGVVDPGPDVHAWMPAVAVDGNGNLGIGFSLGGPNQYYGAGFTGRLATDPLGETVLPVTEFVVGQANYEAVDGAGRNRWGDYSGLAIDPSDDATFWALNEYAGPNNTWATQFVSFQLQEPTDEDWLQFGVQAGDILRIETFTPAGGPFAAVNELDPDLEIFDASGALLPYANRVGNELLFHVAEQTGQYRLRVYAEDSEGEYFVQIEGATGDSLAPTVINTIPDDGLPLAAFPLNYTLAFSESLQIGSVTAEDLSIGGLPALSVTPLDGQTFEFAVDPAANLGDRVYQVELAAGAVVDLQGETNDAFSATFRLDTTPPAILETFWNGLPIRSSRQYEDGPLSFQALLSEDLFLAGTSRRGPFTPGFDDVLLVNNLTGEVVTPLSVSYSRVTDLLEVQFDSLLEGDYSLTLLSGDGSLEDLVGNDLDGEPFGPGIDGAPTGDGAEGGDYIVNFTIDATEPQLNPFAPVDPLGGLVFASEATRGLINSTGDQDVFEFFVEAGQTVTAVATPLHPTTTLSLELLGLAERAISVAPGLPVYLPLTSVTGNTLTQLRVSGSLLAEFELDVYLNAAIESAIDDTAIANPLAIDDSFLSLGSGRYGVVGAIGPVAETDAYAIDLSGSIGESIDVVLDGQRGVDFSGATLELLDASGNVLAVGSSDPLGAGAENKNFDLAILDFVVPNVGASIFNVRLTTSISGDYGLIVADSIVFDVEPNDSPAVPLRSLDRRTSAVGYLDRSVDAVLYGATRAGELLTIDTSTGAGALVGLLENPSTEIEYDPLTGRAFSQFPDGSFAGQEFDIDTGDSLGVAVSNGFAFNGMEWIGTDLFATAISAPRGPSELRILDPATGDSTLIGATGHGPIAGLAYDPKADELLGIAGGPGPADLYRINRTTGVATVIGSTGIQAGSLEFDLDGVLYAGGTGSDEGNLYRIDPVTGASTLLGHAGFGPLTGLLLRDISDPAGGNVDAYAVTLAAGQSFSATTVTLFDHPLTQPANRLDPALRIMDPAGNEIASDSDSVDGRNATVSIQASVAGTYQLQIVSQSEHGGSYLLTTDKGAAPGDADGNGVVSGWDFLMLQRAAGETWAWQAGYGGGTSTPTSEYFTRPTSASSFAAESRSRGRAELTEVDVAYAQFDARRQPESDLVLGRASENDVASTPSGRRVRTTTEAAAVDEALAAAGRWDRFPAL